MTIRNAALVGVTLVAAFVLGACDGEAADTTTVPTPSSTAASSTTTTVAPSTTTTTVIEVESVDLVYTGGDVVTMDPSIGTAEAIAIVGDVIAAVGTAEEIAAFIDGETIVVDLDGRAVHPGFVDAHTHILTDAGGIAAGQPLALATGITSLGDATIEPGLAEEFIAASESGLLKIRTSLYFARTDPCGADQGTWYEEFPANGELADRVHVGGVKIFADGGVCGRIAASEPWLAGVPLEPPYHMDETLTGWIREANDAGYQLLIHAQGDLAMEQIQDSYEEVLAGSGNPLRHRIDHNVFVTPRNAARFGELDIMAAVFGVSAACQADIGWEDFYKQYGDRPNAINLVNPDLKVAWHGDDPFLAPIDPILELYSMVTRNNIADDGSICFAPDWMVGGAVDMQTGLEMMTINSAYALRRDEAVGSLAPGKYADLIVVPDNLLTLSPDSLPSITVLATVIGGVTEYCAPGGEAMCPGYEAPPEPDIPSGGGASASTSLDGNGPELAFDGSFENWSVYSAGALSPQWIRYDFFEPVTLTAIRMTVNQLPAGRTVHELELLIGGEWQPTETFAGTTDTNDVLTWTPEGPIGDVEAFRITTTESPAWPEWIEIEFDLGS